MTDGRRTQKRIFPGRPARPRGSRQEQDKKNGVSRSVGSTGNPDKNVCGGVLLSHTLPGAVPSPCQALASGFGKGPGVTPGPLTTISIQQLEGFGKGPGVTPGPWPPQKPPSTARTPKKTGTPTGQKENHPRAATGACRDGPGTGQRTRTPFRDHRNNAPCRQQSRSSKDADPPPHKGEWAAMSPSPVSTGRLHPSRGFHLRPIKHVFHMRASGPRRAQGILISEQASRLDAFSGYPSRT